MHTSNGRFLLFLIFSLGIFQSPFTHAMPPALIAQSGQTLCYNTSGVNISCPGTGQDGDKMTGVASTAPRFTVNVHNDGVTPDGTVTDNLTGLIWLKYVDCFSTMTWGEALTSVRIIAADVCNLTDGSTAGQWRLPNINELESLVDAQQSSPAIPSGHPFAGVQSGGYWSSSTDTVSTDKTWYVNMNDGASFNAVKSYNGYHIWPVRGRQKGL